VTFLFSALYINFLTYLLTYRQGCSETFGGVLCSTAWPRFALSDCFL